MQPKGSLRRNFENPKLTLASSTLKCYSDAGSETEHHIWGGDYAARCSMCGHGWVLVPPPLGPAYSRFEPVLNDQCKLFLVYGEHEIIFTGLGEDIDLRFYMPPPERRLDSLDRTLYVSVEKKADPSWKMVELALLSFATALPASMTDRVCTYRSLLPFSTKIPRVSWQQGFGECCLTNRNRSLQLETGTLPESPSLLRKVQR